MNRLGSLVMAALLLGACGTPATSGPGTEASSSVPARLDIVCHKDGSTELLNDEVRTQPDGVHVQVDNRAGEFVSLNGLGLDFSEGITEQVARVAPGEEKIACWPGSKHRGPEPERIPIEVVDPDGYWVAAELECPRDELIADSILDYVMGSEGTQGDPEEITRERLKGLEPSDSITTVGYPDSESREVAVERNEETIAIVSFSRAEGGGWLLSSYSSCDSARIRV